MSTPSIFKKNKLLLAVLTLAALLRLYNITGNPPSPYWDEVSIGYNAYSISQTGRDEWGKFLPTSFEAFGEYKLPGQIYLTAPFTAIFGLNTFAVRLPSAVMGVLAIFAIYLVCRQFATKITPTNAYKIAIFAGFLLAISPWHLQFSRPAFEANSAITFYGFGLYFLLAAQTKPRNLLLAAIFFAISFYFYYHTRIIIPLVLIFYLILYHRNLFTHLRASIISLAIGLILCLPILTSLTSPEGVSRTGSVSIINLQTPQANPEFVKAFEKYQSLPIPSNFKDKLAWGDVLFSHYLSHFDLNFLFIKGDNQTRHNSVESGLLYYFQVPLILLACFTLVKKHNRESLFIILLSLVFPVSAIFSDLTPHALRSSLGSFNLTILSAFGLPLILKQKKVIKITFAIFIILSVFFNLYRYHLVSPSRDALAWGYGHQQLFEYLKPIQDPIIITGRYWNPYIYFLYYNQIPPQKYQSVNTKKSQYLNYHFAGAGWDNRDVISDEMISSQTTQNQKVIIVTSPAEDSSITTPKKHLHTIFDREGSPIFYIYQTIN